MPERIYSLLTPLFILTTVAFILIFTVRLPQDVSVYECYARVFWNGSTHIDKSLLPYCEVFSNERRSFPVHTLPSDYPLLALIPFSVPLLLPVIPYEQTFIFMQISIVLGMYLYYRKFMDKRISRLFLLLILICAPVIATRFDLIPAVITVGVITAAERKRFLLAYILLAIATFMKVYPVVLIIPLFLWEVYHPIDDFSRRKYVHILTYILILSIFSILAYLFDPSHAFRFVASFFIRPFQMESFPTTILWIFALLFHIPFCLIRSFGSINLGFLIFNHCQNIDLPHSSILQLFSFFWCFVFVLGVISISSLLYQKKMTLAEAFSAIILVILCCSKILSPQYFIWVIPPIVLSRRFSFPFYFLLACLLLTSCIYPWLYIIIQNIVGQSIFSPSGIFIFGSIATRNILLVIFTIHYINSSRLLKHTPTAHDRSAVRR